MQPIILLAIVGIAGGAMSVGFLGNVITLDVQNIGVGETNLTTDIFDADIDFVIGRQSAGTTSTFESHNVIEYCIIDAGQTIVKDSKVFCKLTDVIGNVVAEGKTVIIQDITPNVPFSVMIDPTDFPNNKVQNIHDVVLVIQSP